MAGRRFFTILILILGLTIQAHAITFPLIVQISPSASITTVAATLGGTVIDSIPSADTYLLKVPFLPPPVTLSQLGILWMELNKSVTLPRIGQRGVLQVPATAAADWYKNQPWIHLIKAGNALQYSTGAGVVVADINSQIDFGHPALTGHLTSGYDFVATRPPGSDSVDPYSAGFMDTADAAFMDTADAAFMDTADAAFMDQSDPILLEHPNPAYSHGTASAGIIAAVSPGSMIMPLRAFDDGGHSDLFTLAKAIRYAADHGVQVINLIFGSFTHSLSIERAVQYAQSSSVLLVAAAGNTHTSQPEYPSVLNGVLAVAATNLSDTKSTFSSYGSHLFAAAPGVNIISAYPQGYYVMVSGTSVSSAVVAATAALVRSARTTGVANSIADGSININASNPNYVNQLGHGRIDALLAVVPPGTPVIATVSPNTGEQGANLQVSITARSTHFEHGMTQLGLGPGLTISNVVVTSPTSLTAQMNIAASAPVGLRTLTATTGTEVVTLDNAFTVVPGTPAITTVSPNTGYAGQSLAITVTGQFTSFAQQTTQVSFGTGVTIATVTVTSPASLTAQLEIGDTAAQGPRQVTVTTGTKVQALSNGFTVTIRPPVITAVTPNNGQQGQNVTLTVTGEFTHFAQGTTQVSIDGITVNNVIVTNANSLTAQLTIPAAAALGSRTLTVTTNSEVATLSNAFSVTAGTPVLTAANPNTGKQGDTVTISVMGEFTHFAQQTTQVSLDGITVNGVTVGNATSLAAQLTIPAAAALGSRTLTVTTGSEVLTLNNAFSVMPGTPVITTVNPNTAQQGQNLSVTVTGQFTAFVAGTTQVSFGADITVSNVTVASATSLTAQLEVAGTAAVGSRNVTMTTGAEAVTLNNGFTVTIRPPVIPSVAPNTGQQGQNVTLAVTGEFTHFAQGTTQVTIGGITVNSITVNNVTSLTAQLTIPATATLGSRTLTVTTGSEVATLNNAFSVTAGTPVITAANPISGKQGDTLTLSVAGQFTHFTQETTQVGVDGITVNSITVTNSTSLTAHLTIPAAAAIGSRTLTVTTGTEAATLSNAFSAAPGTPVITTISPNTAQQAQNLSVNLTGQFTGFAQGITQVSFGADVTVTNLTVAGPTSLTAQLEIGGTAAVGSRNVTVTTGAESVTLNNSFTVTVRPPIITSVTPNSGQQGQNVTLAVTGQFTHFAQGTTQVTIGGITVNSVIVTDPTSLTAYVTVPAAAALGSRTLTITTGSEAATLSNAFSATPGTPVITILNPNTGQQGQNLSVNVTGQFTGFVQGTTQVSFGADVTVTNVTVAGPTSLTAQLEIGGTAAVGSRSVTVTTGAEAVTLNNGFTVTLRPAIISSVTPNTGQQGQNVTMAVTGEFTHFAPGITRVTIDGITVNSVTVTNAGSLAVFLTIPPGAALGSRTVTATTGSEVVTVSNAFSVMPGTPVITAISPNTGREADTVIVAIAGQFTHFIQGMTSVHFGPGLIVNALTVSSATSLTVQLTIPGIVVPGSDPVTVATGAEVVTVNNGFSVTPITP